MRTITATLAVLSAAALPAALPAQTPATATEAGKVEAVTLYRGQALVTRVVPLPARTGPIEVVVPRMPAGIVAGSLYAEGGETTEIRAVRYRQRAVGEAPRDEIRALDLQIAEAQATLAANQANQSVVQARIKYLDRLEGFVAPTAHADLAKGALDAEALERLVEFGFKQRQKASDDLMSLRTAAQKLAAQIELLGRQRGELSAGTSKTLREAVLFLEKRQGGAGSLRLSYLVSGCGWSPAYNLRADRATGTVRVEYDAHIQQRTGENWNGVKLTLSTASPALSAEGPGLAPFSVMLTGNTPQQPQGEKVAELYKAIAMQQQQARFRNTQEISQSGNFDSAWDVNRAANAAQVFELRAGKEVLSSLRRESTEQVDGPSLSYSLDGRVSLASRPDQQMVRILRAELPASLRYVAMPVLSAHVYREAELTNTSGQDFLAGPVSAYLDGRFVGRAEIGNVAQGQALVVGLGADPGLLARREILNKEERVQGGNRIVDLKVRLKIENFHNAAVAIRVFDRLPYAGGSKDLRVALGAMSDEISKDAVYVAAERPKGILRWDVEIAASAGGEKARAVDYEYTLEFDRNLYLNTESGQADGSKQVFRRLQKARGRR